MKPLCIGMLSLLLLNPEVTLTNRVFEEPFVAWSTDAYCPALGIPLTFRRVMPNDHANFPNLGPFGIGWPHNYEHPHRSLGRRSPADIYLSDQKLERAA